MKKEKEKSISGFFNRQTMLKIFYIVSLVYIALVFILRSSFFAYDIFSSLGFLISVQVVAIIVCVVRTVETFRKQINIFGKVISIALPNSVALSILLMSFLDNRALDIVFFLCLIFHLVLLIILAFKRLKSKTVFVYTRFDVFLSLLPFFALLSTAMSQKYINDEWMFVPIVIIGVVLSGISIMVFFLKFAKNISYFKESKKETVAAPIVICIVAFCFALFSVFVINYSFDYNGIPTDVVVTNKEVSSGYLRPTIHKLLFYFEGQQHDIAVSSHTYFTTEIGDTVTINYYNGALGYSYFIYEY